MPQNLSPARPVRRRRVFYFSGFDPQGPSHYHALYRTESAKQAIVSGFEVEVSARRRLGEHVTGWSVDALWGHERTHTEFEFMRWDDLVRHHWPRGRWALLRSTVQASVSLWRNGVMWQTLRTSWPAFLAVALPGALVAGLVLGSLGLCALAWALTQFGHPVSAVAALLVGLSLLAWLGRRAEARTHMAWLMRSLAFIVRQGRGQAADLEARLDRFAEHLSSALDDQDCDEWLIVGHSSGAMLAVSTLARALARRQSIPIGSPSHGGLSLLTLGQCMPMLSYQPEASAFRAELARVALDARVQWIDFGAPPDGCCFALADPTWVCGDVVPGERRPKLLSPRFASLFSPAAYRKLKVDRYRCHFQYLMAGELAGDYDYFAVTSGPQRLADRFASTPTIRGFVQFQRFGGPRP